MTLKFALTGVHGSGKTTLLSKIAAELTERDITYVCVNKVARLCPHPIGLHTSIMAQAWIFTEQIRQELYAMNTDTDVVLCDRTLMDNIMYIKRFVFIHNVPYSTYYMWKAAERWQDSYDIILRLPLNIMWVLNRDHDKDTEKEIIKFAEDIDELFDNYVHGDMVTWSYHKSPPSADTVVNRIEAEMSNDTT